MAVPPTLHGDPTREGKSLLPSKWTVLVYWKEFINIESSKCGMVVSSSCWTNGWFVKSTERWYGLIVDSSNIRMVVHWYMWIVELWYDWIMDYCRIVVWLSRPIGESWCGRIVESSNSLGCEWWYGWIEESSGSPMVYWLNRWNGGVVELLNCLTVEWWYGWIVEFSNGDMVRK